MASIAPFRFPPLNTSRERASVLGTTAPTAGLPSKHVAQCKKPGASAPPRSPRRAAAAGRASPGCSKPAVDTGSPGNRASFVGCGKDETNRCARTLLAHEDGKVSLSQLKGRLLSEMERWDSPQEQWVTTNEIARIAKLILSERSIACASC